MNIHEFGRENKETVLLIHPSLVKWDYFEYVIPLLEKDYHLVIPALPGYDFDERSDFTSVEQIADELNGWLEDNDLYKLYAIYGCSMGGSIALLTALGQKVSVKHCIMDGGITPYRLPWLLTRVIALKDYLMMMIGKAGGVSLLEKTFATDEYSKEDLEYAAGEEKARSSDIKYMKDYFPQTEFTRLPKLGHAGLVLLKPELFAGMIKELN